MSRRREPHYPTDKLGDIARRGSGTGSGITFVDFAGAPTNGQPGYAKGCIWINTNGSVGTLIYGNTGSNTSTTWTNIL